MADNSAHPEEMYGTSVSHTTLSEITVGIILRVREWQHGPLEAVCCIVWLDAMYFKVKDAERRVLTRWLYNMLGIRVDGAKEVVCAYVSEAEGALLAKRAHRPAEPGLPDLLIACYHVPAGLFSG